MKALYLTVTTCLQLAIAHLYSPQVYAPVSYTAYSAPSVSYAHRTDNYAYTRAVPALLTPPPVVQKHYVSPLRTSVGYGPLASARLSAPSPYLSYSPPAPIYTSSAEVNNIRAPIFQPSQPIYTASSEVSHVPVATFEPRPSLIQKFVDVAQPQIATRKIKIRRPAIQKHFYDVEERIVVRPIGSAVLELDEPLSRSQAGPTVVRPAFVPFTPARTTGVVYGPPSTPAPVYGPPSTPAPVYGPPTTPAPEYGPPSTQPPPQETTFAEPPQEFDDTDSITVESPAKSRSQNPRDFLVPPQSFQPQSFLDQEQKTTTEQEVPEDSSEPSSTEVRFLSRSNLNLVNNYLKQTPSLRNLERTTSSESSKSTDNEDATVVPSFRSNQNPEQDRANQQRLIEFLLGKGGVTEIRSGVTIDNLGQGGQVKARVLSVTPAPPSADAADERVSTRRFVVNRPIQTEQEVDVVQPFTKVQRISVQQPALINSPRIGLARVNTLRPVPVAPYTHY